MAVDVRRTSRESIEKRLVAFEHRYEMNTDSFIDAFRNGRLHETPDFHTWARLVAALKLFDRSKE
jgi:hypothetical protein